MEEKHLIKSQPQAAPLVINSASQKRKRKPYTKVRLRELLKNPPDRSLLNDRLFKHVGRWILKEAYRSYPVKSVLNDLLRSGCDSGMVSHLIYYCDTHRFYRKYMDEIHKLMDEAEDASGEPLLVKYDRANWYAWFGFEEMAFKISELLEAEDQEENDCERV